jgi:hypothetical protein
MRKKTQTDYFWRIKSRDLRDQSGLKEENAGRMVEGVAAYCDIGQTWTET